jgi:hypothetical protein
LDCHVQVLTETEDQLSARNAATTIRDRMGYVLNPVFRSIVPKNNHPKNLPVHGLNVFAFARIQIISNGEIAPSRKGRCASLARWPAGQP